MHEIRRFILVRGGHSRVVVLQTHPKKKVEGWFLNFVAARVPKFQNDLSFFFVCIFVAVLSKVRTLCSISGKIHNLESFARSDESTECHFEVYVKKGRYKNRARRTTRVYQWTYRSTYGHIAQQVTAGTISIEGCLLATGVCLSGRTAQPVNVVATLRMGCIWYP